MRKALVSASTAILFILFLMINPASADTNVYIVKPGDNLYRIAAEHKLSVDKLRHLNQLVSDNILVGQKLMIQPSANDETPKTSVQPSKQQYITITQAGKKVRVPLLKPPVANVSANLTPSAEKLLQSITNKALTLQGIPYIWGGITTSGFDCSGFIYHVLKTSGVDLPRMDMLSMFSNSTAINNPVPGDLVFFENTYRSGISHAGIYLGNDKFIHAGSKQVEIASFRNEVLERKIRRFYTL